ncbi:MAG TPA: hypothetical protein VNB94_08645 [Mycobacteriales bacterium]|nr:hypothetical protein [Mycobacteriales bacterium]
MEADDQARGARGTAVALGVLTFGLGVWALIAPRSFFDTIATFEPYNRHFTHDSGALQMGVGAALLLSAVTERRE